MSLQDSYNMLEMMSKRFKVGDNTKTKSVQRTASVVNNSNIYELDVDDKQDQLCAKTISEIVKLVNDKVKVQGKQTQQQRTASVTNKTDEVGLLQSFLSR